MSRLRINGKIPKLYWSDAQLNRVEPENRYCETIVGEFFCEEIVSEENWEEHQMEDALKSKV